MNLQTMLSEKGLTMYKLSKASGVPKTTVIDICSGKSEIGACNARTVQRLGHRAVCGDVRLPAQPGVVGVARERVAMSYR